MTFRTFDFIQQIAQLEQKIPSGYSNLVLANKFDDFFIEKIVKN